MAQPHVRIPLQFPLATQVGLHTYRIIFWLELLNSTGAFKHEPTPFRLDTGADFTTIPARLADSIGLNYRCGKEVFPNTAAGKGSHPSYLTQLRFSFPTIPKWQFQSNCLVTPYPLKRCLFSLNDLVPHFIVRSNKATAQHPFGSVVFQLRSDHGGLSRS